MASSTGKGKISRIVPALASGAVVTIPRYMTDIVVTEFGVAELRGKSSRQRAEALISIAHPDFQDRLWEARSKTRSKNE
jgi:4-hydroxybutyrate CoA-transferase